MVEPQLGGVNDRAKAGDQPAVDQSLDALLARRLRQADALRQFGVGHPPVAAQYRDDLAIEFVQIDHDFRICHTNCLI